MRSCNGIIKTGLVSMILLPGMSCVAMTALPGMHIRHVSTVTQILAPAFWGIQRHCQSRSSIQNHIVRQSRRLNLHCASHQVPYNLISGLSCTFSTQPKQRLNDPQSPKPTPQHASDVKPTDEAGIHFLDPSEDNW